MPLSSDGSRVDRAMELEEWTSNRDLAASERERMVWSTEIAGPA